MRHLNTSHPELMTLQAAATQLGIDYRTVYRLVRGGQLPAVKVCGAYRLRVSDVDTFHVDFLRSSPIQRAAAPLSPQTCSRCRRLIKQADSTESCTHGDCAALLCRRCRNVGRVTCLVHARDQQSNLASPANHATVAESVAQRGSLFQQRMYRKLSILRAVPHPRTGGDCRLQAQSGPAGDSGSCAAVAPVRFLARRRGSNLLLETRVLRTDKPVDSAALWQELQNLVRRAQQRDALVVAGLAACDWSPAAWSLVTGTPGSTWAGDPVIPFLINLTTGQVAGLPTEDTAGYYRALFHPLLHEEAVLEVERHLDRQLPVAETLSVAEVKETLAVPTRAIVDGFRRKERSGRYLLENSGSGLVIASAAGV